MMEEKYIRKLWGPLWFQIFIIYFQLFSFNIMLAESAQVQAWFIFLSFYWHFVLVSNNLFECVCGPRLFSSIYKTLVFCARMCCCKNVFSLWKLYTLSMTNLKYLSKATFPSCSHHARFGNFFFFVHFLLLASWCPRWGRAVVSLRSLTVSRMVQSVSEASLEAFFISELS